MKLTKTNRGFYIVEGEVYPPRGCIDKDADYSRILQESSAIGGYDNAFDIPGSSFLWVGDQHHLCREEVAKLAIYLNRWLDTGRLGD